MRKFISPFTALIIFIIASLWILWPLGIELSEGFISPKEKSDANQYIWNAWNFSERWHASLNPFYTDALVTGTQLNLWMHTYTPIMSIWCLMFNDPLTGVNLFLLLNFILAAMGARKLALMHQLPETAALLIGLLFAFAPIKLLHLPQHYHLMLQGAAPWYLVQSMYLFKIETGVKEKRNRIIYAFLLWLITFLGDYYTAAFLLYFTTGFIIYPRIISIYNGPYRKKLLISLLLFSIICITLVYILKGKVDDKAGLWWGADLLSFFIPDENTLFPQRATITALIPGASHLMNSYEHQVFLGLTLLSILSLYIYHIIRRGIQGNIWLVLALFCILVSLPVIKFNGHFITYSPTALTHFIPFFNNIRCPTRILTFLPLLLSLGIFTAWKNHYSSKKLNTLYIVLGLTTLFTLKTKPLPMVYQKDIPKVISVVKKSAGNILLPIPTGITDGMHYTGRFNVNQLYWQTIHQKKIIGAYIARIPKKTFLNFKHDSLMKGVCELSEGQKPAYIYHDHSAFQPDLILIERQKVDEHSVLIYLQNITEKIIYQDHDYLLLQTKKAAPKDSL